MLLTVLLLIQGTPASPQRQPLPQSASRKDVQSTAEARSAVSGIVVRAGSDSPVADARVTLTASLPPSIEDWSSYLGEFKLLYLEGRKSFLSTAPAHGAWSRNSSTSDTKLSATAGDDGRFFIRDVPPGAYWIAVDADGYTLQSAPDIPAVMPVKLIAGQTIGDIVIRMTPGGSIDGYVQEEGSGAAAGIPVYLWRYSYGEGGQRHMDVVAGVATDDRGRYRIFWIPPGRYYLAAGGTARKPFIFYPSGTDPAEAEAVDIAPGIAQTVNWTLPRFQTFRLHARITDSQEGRPPVDPNIRIKVRAAPEQYDWVSNRTLRYDHDTGVLEIWDLFPGSYTIEVDTGQDVTPVFAVKINDADVDGHVLDLSAEPPEHQTIRGRIKTDASELPPMEGLSIVLRPDVGPSRSFDAESDGTFLIPVGHDLDDFDAVVAGDKYHASVDGLPSGWYVREAKLAGNDALTASVRVRGSAGMEVTLSPRAGLVAGVVNGADRKPLAGVKAILVPARLRERADLFAVAATDGNGRFSFLNVAPGDYAIYAWEALQENAYYDPHVLAMFEGKGAPVHVEESSRNSVNVTLIPAGDVR